MPHQGFRATYAELWGEVDRAARALLARGVRQGDRVGIWAPNRYEWVVTQFATARIGAILVTINPAYKAAELEYALRQDRRQPARHGARLPRHRLRRRCSSEVAPRPACRRDRARGRLGRLPGRGRAASPTRELAEREAALHPGDPINIQYTSGTTGAPKGATLTHRNILNNAYFTGRTMGYTEHDRVCVPVPFYHTFGMVLGSLACVDPRRVHGRAGRVVRRRARCWRRSTAERCTSLYGVPTMFIAELGRAAVRALRPLEPAHRA